MYRGIVRLSRPGLQLEVDCRLRDWPDARVEIELARATMKTARRYVEVVAGLLA
jgi:hypothetical protein